MELKNTKPRKTDARRARMLEDGERLFFEKGYLETSLADLLERMDCSKGTFYHYFDTKLTLLSELCHEHARDAFRLYQGERVQTPMERLNALLYYSLPFRAGEEEYLLLLAPMRGGEENAVAYVAWTKAMRTVFMPELERVLESLRDAGKIHYRHPALPALLWEAHLAFALQGIYALFLRDKCEARMLDVINAARFQWERLLDAPYGEIEVVRLPEVLTVAARVSEMLAARARRE